jgi:hypothetical protein
MKSLEAAYFMLNLLNNIEKADEWAWRFITVIKTKLFLHWIMLALFKTPKINSRLAACAAFGLGVAAQAAPLNTSDPTQIANFENGATVETFDSIAGVTAVSISDYNAKDLTLFPAAQFNKDAAQPAFYNSGGASFNDPVGNPGVPIGIAAPTGGIAANKFSGANVAGPIGEDPITPVPILFGDGAIFMEVIFPTLVSKVGLYVASGNLSLFLKDSNNSNLATGDFQATGAAGEYIGLERASADVGGVTIVGQGAFTIDDFTYLVGTTTGNDNNNTTAPDSGSTFGLALGAMSLILGSKRFLKPACC